MQFTDRPNIAGTQRINVYKHDANSKLHSMRKEQEIVKLLHCSILINYGVAAGIWV